MFNLANCIKKIKDIGSKLPGDFRLWLDGVLFVSTVVAFLWLLYEFMPDDLKIQMDTRYRLAIFLLFAIMFLFVMVVTYRSLFYAERDRRELEESFHYARDVLYNGTEPNIAFRIVTFKNMLGGMASKIGKNVIQSTLNDVGRTAAADFASHLPEIYDQNVSLRGLGKKRWQALSFEEQINAWANYDTRTGWGAIKLNREVIDRQGQIAIKIDHPQNLFDGDAGLYFAHFLAGYCETVLTTLLVELNKHPEIAGKYRNFSRAELVNMTPRDGEVVEFTYKWQ